MADAPEPAAVLPAVERRIVSVLFADLVGFTPLSERSTPRTWPPSRTPTSRRRARRSSDMAAVEKFIGDAAMAVFGAPRARDDDAERAVHAGLALLGAIEQIGARLGMDAGTLQLRVGRQHR